MLEWDLDKMKFSCALEPMCGVGDKTPLMLMSRPRIIVLNDINKSMLYCAVNVAQRAVQNQLQHLPQNSPGAASQYNEETFKLD